MVIKRRLNSIQTPPAHRGFLGNGHVARAVIQNNFAHTDPFILLMDDSVVVPQGEPVGGPHPHAGFETVTLVLEGEVGDGDDLLAKGDFQMMTAGSGVVHTETIEPETKMHVLQLWLTLPKKDRWVAPRVQELHFKEVPKFSENGVDISLYSGNFAGKVSPIANYTPVIIADFKMQSGATTTQQLPASYNTFLYVLEGSVEVGEGNDVLQQNQSGWLDKFFTDEVSELTITAGQSGARFVLYAGQPQQDSIVSYGPFIGDTEDDIRRLYSDYRQGKMRHISTYPKYTE
jgi:quercetin 2,3-dioxygenase